jgi:hypothetical protein
VNVSRRPRPDLRAAPMRRRALASAIDVLRLGLVLTWGGVYAVRALTRREPAVLGPSASSKIAASASGKLGLRLCGLLLGFLMASRQSPGSRVAGIRPVDTRTGGKVSFRQAAIQVGARAVWESLAKRMSAPLLPQRQDDLRDVQSDVEALKLKHSGDEAALQGALMDLYSERRIGPHGACLPAILWALLGASIEAPILWTELKQGVPEILAKTAIVIDR